MQMINKAIKLIEDFKERLGKEPTVIRMCYETLGMIEREVERFIACVTTTNHEPTIYGAKVVIDNSMPPGIMSCHYAAPALITINGIEIEAPFMPSRGEEFWCFNMFGEVRRFIFNPDIGDHLRNAATGNCFRTDKAALAAFGAVSKALNQKVGEDVAGQAKQGGV